MDGLLERLDELPRPAWIALVVLAFILFWPLGVALLIYLKWSGRMFCSRYGYGRWTTPDGHHYEWRGNDDSRQARDQARAEWRAKREEWRSWKRRQRWGHGSTSGNVAFDEYRDETLRKLDEEQREFHEYLDKLRSAKDRAEFDQFMAERRDRTSSPPPSEPAPNA
jgi:hypothetical protein